jgi:general secretion pathway protein F
LPGWRICLVDALFFGLAAWVMKSPTLDDFMAWNEQLAALVGAKVPLQLGLSPDAHDAARQLEKINALVARRTSQGASLAAALEADDDVIAPAYRAVALEGIHDGDLTAGLPAATQLAVAAQETKQAVGMTFLYPLLVCCLAIAGLVGFCVMLAPRLETAFSELRVQPQRGMKLLEVLRTAMPLWAIGLPLGLVALTAWGRLRSKRAGSDGGRSRWALLLPGFSRADADEQTARAAEMLAALLDKGTPLDGALRIVAEGCGDAGLRVALKSLANTAAADQPPADRIDVANRLPPFFCWALLHSAGTTGRPAALRMAATIYHDAARRRRSRLRLIAPLLAMVVVGGSVTLLYGLTLFLPVIDLLYGLAYSTP